MKKAKKIDVLLIHYVLPILILTYLIPVQVLLRGQTLDLPIAVTYTGLLGGILCLYLTDDLITKWQQRKGSIIACFAYLGFMLIGVLLGFSLGFTAFYLITLF